MNETVPIVALLSALVMQGVNVLEGDWLQQGSFGLLAFVIFYMMRYGVSAITTMSEQMTQNTIALAQLKTATLSVSGPVNKE